MRSWMVLAALLTFVSTTAQAEIYECVRSDGNKCYTNRAEEATGCKILTVGPIIPAPTRSKQETDKERKAREKAAAERAARGPVRIGMTKDEALASSWGKPQSRSRTTTAARVREQWIYSNGHSLYFDNGVLTVIQE